MLASSAGVQRGWLMQPLSLGLLTHLGTNLEEKLELEMLSLEETLALPQCMTSLPSVEDYINILQSCRKDKNLHNAIRVHTQIHESGLETQRELGNHLVPMLVECGGISDAQNIFYRLVHRNEYCWTSLIQGYIQCGESHLALILYQKMQESCVSPSRFTLQALLKACIRLKDMTRGQELHTEIVKEGLERDPFIVSILVDVYAACGFLEDAWEISEEVLDCFETMQLKHDSVDPAMLVCSLKACGTVEAIKKGREIHAEIAKEGFERDPFVGNTLLDMYSKCGSVADAQEVFHELPVQDAVSWTIVIQAYAEHGLGAEALHCWKQMQSKGVTPSIVTLVCILKACASKGAIERGQEMHVEIVREGLESDLYVASTLVGMYGKCSLLEDAQEVFNDLPDHSVVSWNALITGYVEEGLGEEALHCFEQMQLEGVLPNAVTFAETLKGCGTIGAMDRGRKIHAEICKKGFEIGPFFCSILVDMYMKGGLLADARDVFEDLPVQNVISWTALIAGHAEHGLSEEALKCLEQMQLEGISPNTVTYTCSLKACVSMKAIGRGQELHVQITKVGYEKDLLVGNMLVDMYAKCGLLIDAQRVFDKMPVRSVVTWTALIEGYTEHGLRVEAWKCLKHMELEGVSPNAVTFVCSLRICASIGAIGWCHELHSEIAKEGFELDSYVGNMLVNVYSKCGVLTDAQRVFDELLVRDVVSWNALIAGYAYQGESELVFHMLERMTKERICPNDITFLSVLSVCSHVGLVDKGQVYFEALIEGHGLTLGVEHQNCIVALLARTGRIDEAFTLMEKLPFQPNLVTWNTVLGACQKLSNVELGRHAFEAALTSSKTQGTTFILMSNIYADAQMW